MKTYLSHTFRKVTARFTTVLRPERNSGPPPDHVVTRLERVFEALSELSSQPNIAAALEFACDTLQAELPSQAVAAGLHDINSDAVRIVAARGFEQERMRGMSIPRAHCLVGYAAEQAIIASGDADGVNWLGAGGEGSTVLLCPILHDGHLLGVLGLADPVATGQFTRHDLELVGYVASQLAVFIHAYRHRASLAARARENRGF